MNYQNYQNLMLLTSSDTKRTHVASILVNKIHPKRTGFNIYAEYIRPQLTFLALHPWFNVFLLKLREKQTCQPTNFKKTDFNILDQTNV